MLSAEGCVDGLPTDDPSCCPPPLCGNDLCCTFVAFFNLLPSGPLWDHWKQQAIEYFQRNEDPRQCPLLQNPACPSLVLHAIYAATKLKFFVDNALWPALRESHPTTAVTTLDDHLRRLQWEDCYRQHCRSVLLGGLTPYEVMGPCGPIFCEPDFPDDLICAVKRNTAISLTRANVGIVKNLCSINWVIEPLGAAITPVDPQPNPVPDPAVRCDDLCPDDGDLAFEICNTRDWLHGCPPGDVCDTRTAPPQIQAYWDRGCDRPAGLPDRIWPAVLVAECIVRSLLPPICPSIIRRCC